MVRSPCPICKRLMLVQADGPVDSPLLIIGEFPGIEEVKQGRPWVGPAGKVLDRELELAGIPRDICRVTNLWLHTPPTAPKTEKPKTKSAIERWEEAAAAYEPEFTFHYTRLLKEIKGRKALLMMGSDVTEALIGRPVSLVAGCFIKSGRFITAVNLPKVTVAMMNPAIVFRSGKEGKLGETRLAIQRFAGAVNELKL